MTVPAAPLLEVRGLRKRFGNVHALRGVDLAVPAGQVVAILGPNGAGKSTLLRIVAGLMRPSAGEVLLQGDAASADPVGRLRRIGLLSHHTMLYDALSARENLAFASRLHGIDQWRSRVDQLLRALDLVGRADDPVGQLSRGTAQRVAIARTLLHDPELLLLDEPHSGLDEAACRSLAGLLAAGRRRGRAALLVTHDLGRALSLADRIVVIAGGRVASDQERAAVDEASFADAYLRRIGEAAVPERAARTAAANS